VVVASVRWRSSRWLRASMQPTTVLGLMMIAACWLGLTYILSIERGKSVEGAIQQGANLARLVEENIVSTLNGIDRALLLLREAYERDPDHFDLRDWTKRAIVTDLTLRLSVVGADGFMIGTTQLGAGDVFERVYLGDREYFLAQVDAKTDDPFIGKPVTGRFSGRLTAQISRRLRHPDGSFAGTIVAALDPGFVERFFGAVDLGPQGTALLRGLDGVILASHGFKGQVVGRQVMPAVVRDALARGPSGHYWGKGAIEGVNRLVSYRTLERFRLLVSVGLAEDYIFESYGRNRATYLTIASMVTMLVLIAIVAGIRHQLRLDDIRDDLRRSEAQAHQKARELELNTRELEVTLDHMGQGIIVTDADNHVPVINRRAVELLGLPDSFRSCDNGELLGPEAGDLLVADAPVLENTVYQRTTANGAVLEFHQTPLPDGGVVRTITDITARKHAEQEIVRLAHHDALTSLANRNLLHGRIEQAISRQRRRYGDGLAILCIDLDRFKTVNDTLGHSVGDELLRQLAERLTDCARDLDTVARIGGDEFVVLQTSVNHMDETAALAGRIQQRACEPYSVAGNQMMIGISIGIALAPQDGTNVEQLLRNADLALYRAKAGGRNTICFFNADIEKAVLERHQLERELPVALEKDEFELFYQPWITFADGEFSGCEALLRWRHRERGIIGPGEFIAIAEDIGMIERLGDWVLRRACRDAARWPQPVKVAVNLSAAQFMTGDLYTTVMDALAASGLPPQRLELEITETLLLDHYEGMLVTLHRLRDHGVSIALDDFGTGYSSLTYLRHFRFDRIKIDQTFVAEMTTRSDCAAIVVAVAGLGRSLGVAITAEGIELQDQLMMLRAAGCTDGQGYLICRPTPADDIAGLLSARSAVTSMAS
jgi:diguanylate cyclase (GGDEF)-like protein